MLSLSPSTIAFLLLAYRADVYLYIFYFSYCCLPPPLRSFTFPLSNWLYFSFHRHTDRKYERLLPFPLLCYFKSGCSYSPIKWEWAFRILPNENFNTNNLQYMYYRYIWYDEWIYNQRYIVYVQFYEYRYIGALMNICR